MSVDKLKTDIPDEVIESLARCILPSIRAYFESEEGQREYAEWKETRGKIEKKEKILNLNNMRASRFSARSHLGVNNPLQWVPEI